MSKSGGMRELDVAEPIPGELRNWLVLMLLWVSSSLTFSLLVWGKFGSRSRLAA